jgi:uncharacterized protein YjbI with pentapeptide repeats
VGRKKLVRKAEPESRKVWPRWTGFRGKTAWDWMDLLIVPLALVAIGLLFSMLQDARQQALENQRQEQALAIENKRAEAERELAEQRAQDEALQAYLDQMSQLMLERKLLEAEPGDPVYTLAQARTSTVILRLDAEHNTSVIRFLNDSGLARSDKPFVSILSGIALNRANLSDASLIDVNLSYASLSEAILPEASLGGADLSDAILNRANLSEASLIDANLSGANLSEASLPEAFLGDAILNRANLSEASLIDANLYAADLSEAVLRGTDLRGTYLRGTYLRGADLSEAYLRGADLRGADLRGAEISYAELSHADLSGAKGLTNEELEQQAASLEGATMPNGQKYEDWLKGREKRQQDE